MSASISGKRVIELRAKAGFATQQALAAKAQIDGSKLSRIENDKPVNVTLKTLERLAKALKVNVGELFIEPRPEEGSTGVRARALGASQELAAAPWLHWMQKKHAENVCSHSTSWNEQTVSFFSERSRLSERARMHRL